MTKHDSNAFNAHLYCKLRLLLLLSTFSINHSAVVIRLAKDLPENYFAKFQGSRRTMDSGCWCTTTTLVKFTLLWGAFLFYIASHWHLNPLFLFYFTLQCHSLASTYFCTHLTVDWLNDVSLMSYRVSVVVLFYLMQSLHCFFHFEKHWCLLVNLTTVYLYICTVRFSLFLAALCSISLIVREAVC